MTLKVACMNSESRPRYVAALQDDKTLELVLCDDEAATIAALADCQALVTGGSVYTRNIADALLNGPSGIEWLHLGSTGVDALARFGVPSGVVVTNAPTAVAPAVAEHAMALMLAGKRQIVEIDRKRSESLNRVSFLPGLSSVDGETLLIVGYGNIGSEIARRALAFDMRVVTATRRPHAVANPAVQAHGLHELPDLLPLADVVVVAVALSRDTRHLFGAGLLKRMRKSAWLINIARGDLIDQPALVEALRAGQLFGAALDVTEVEPLPADHPLRTMKNVIVTPHLAGFGSQATQQRLADVAVVNLRRRAAGLPLHNIVDPVNFVPL